MKYLFRGMFVASIALCGSAFTNYKSPTRLNIGGQIGSGRNSWYIIDSYDGRTCDGGYLPCSIIALPGFNFSNLNGIISYSDLNNPLKVAISSTQSSF
ncbi:hypothetical protein [Pedobacter sp.]|jgi:hypothetical protein|uniref:hypothetical protein n=1 Tax=Pedobacter sp. TaxID=1411316 RepID=UPI002BE52812|nr:hypothetical protein [Pedobacter sp.]HWW40149.1 hypothetical protein [Pedobacter sp.]